MISICKICPYIEIWNKAECEQLVPVFLAPGNYCSAQKIREIRVIWDSLWDNLYWLLIYIDLFNTVCDFTIYKVAKYLKITVWKIFCYFVHNTIANSLKQSLHLTHFCLKNSLSFSNTIGVKRKVLCRLLIDFHNYIKRSSVLRKWVKWLKRSTLYSYQKNCINVVGFIKFRHCYWYQAWNDYRSQ